MSTFTLIAIRIITNALHDRRCLQERVEDRNADYRKIVQQMRFQEVAAEIAAAATPPQVARPSMNAGGKATGVGTGVATWVWEAWEGGLRWRPPA